MSPSLIRLLPVAGAIGWLACTAPADRAPDSSTDRTTRDSLLETGRALYLRSEFDSVRALLMPALEAARADGDSEFQAKSLTVLGLAAYREGDYARASAQHREALRLKLTLQLDAELSSSYNALGLIAWNEGRLSDALDQYTAASTAARRVSDDVALAIAANNIGLVQTDLGNFAAARAGFVEMRDIGRRLGDARREGIALNNLGMLDVWIGNPERAVGYLQEARRLFRSVGYLTGQQNALGQLGTAYDTMGEPGKAIAALDSALQQSREQGLRQEEASNLEALADIHHRAGDPQRALELYGQAQTINRELGLTIETGADLRRVAAIYADLDNTSAARDRAAEALALHREAGAPFEELADLLLLAEVESAARNAREAERHLSAARRVAQRLDVRAARVDLALTEARVADRAGEARRVLQVLERAAADVARGGYGAAAETEALRARAFDRLMLTDSSAAAGRRAVAAIERVRGRLASGTLRTSYIADRADIYGQLAHVLIRQSRLEEAFEVAGAARGRALLEHLSSARRENGGARALNDELTQGEELLRAIDKLVEQRDWLEEVPPDKRDSGLLEEIARLDAQLATTRSRYEDALERAALLDPGRAALLGARRVRTSAIRQSLRPGEALLQYLSADDRLLVFVLTPDTIRVHALDVTERDLTGRVRLARDLLGRRDVDGTQLDAVLVGLHELLLQPVLDSGHLNGADHVFIVPHAALTYLPFAALKARATGSYLVEDYTVSHLPAASALPLLRDDRPSTQPDTRFTHATVFAPLPAELPGTREEAKAIERTVRRTREYVGRRATETRVRTALREPRVVHVATHGILNVRSPVFSRLELADTRSDKPDDDGRLEVHEIVGLTVASPLVYLSGCETGTGAAWSTDFARGEDYTTLAQAFLFAGAQNVIATLWRIDDAGAAAFAERFYESLSDAGPAVALAIAQRAMMSHETFSAPYYWAGYRVNGG